MGKRVLFAPFRSAFARAPVLNLEPRHPYIHANSRCRQLSHNSHFSPHLNRPLPLVASTSDRWKADSLISRFGAAVDRVYVVCVTPESCQAIDWGPTLWRNKTQLVAQSTLSSHSGPAIAPKGNIPAKDAIRATVMHKAIAAHAQDRKYKHILVLTEDVIPMEHPRVTSDSLPVASLISRVGAVRLAYNMLKPRKFKSCKSGRGRQSQLHSPSLPSFLPSFLPSSLPPSLHPYLSSYPRVPGPS